MIIHPRPGRLYVKLDEIAEQKSGGGIYIPDLHKQISRRGTVMAAGDDTNISVGARVLVTGQAGIIVDDPELYRHGGQDIHRIMMQSEVQAILEE